MARKIGPAGHQNGYLANLERERVACHAALTDRELAFERAKAGARGQVESGRELSKHARAVNAHVVDRQAAPADQRVAQLVWAAALRAHVKVEVDPPVNGSLRAGEHRDQVGESAHAAVKRYALT